VRRLIEVTGTVLVLAGAAGVVAVRGAHDERSGARAEQARVAAMRPAYANLRDMPGHYIGVYVPGLPESYAGVTKFTAATGVRPTNVTYYSSWQEPFNVNFAATAATHVTAPLIQIDPQGVSLRGIARGRDDGFLVQYADAVRAYRHAVILSFGHEMNADWYSWGYRHTSPATFVAAWRHIVTVFRRQGADNVTWLWTVNVTSGRGVAPFAPWWPGDRYVTWVGIDGYFYTRATTFSGLFRADIDGIRRLTTAPVLITETGATPGVGQAAKVAQTFAGVRKYQLLGAVWFDARGARNWRLRPAALAVIRREEEGATG
jgi:mannan endo-1,4-beta-mannosidase